MFHGISQRDRLHIYFLYFNSRTTLFNKHIISDTGRRCVKVNGVDTPFLVDCKIFLKGNSVKFCIKSFLHLR